MEDKVKQIYNDCWLIYKAYLDSHNMKQYNDQAEELVKKYDCCHEVKGLIWWFTPIVNELHQEHRVIMRKNHEKLIENITK